MNFLEPVIYAFGLKQRWNLFAPDLTRVNQYSTCLITFEDGSLRLYEWPRVDKMSISERFTHQKLRRFVVEFWARPKNKSFWPDSASYFASAYQNQLNPPERIEFIFNYSKIRDFKDYQRRDQLPEHYVKDTVFNISTNSLKPGGR